MEVKARPLILYGIEGHLLRHNDAVFQPALPTSAHPRALANQQTLVFFGGDIQNLAHLMDQTDDSVIDYQTWCLEETALRLSSDFPYCHIVVIKPSRVVFDHMSCYDNFVESNMIGIPKHYYHYVALMHLEKLLKTISRTLRNMDPDDLFKMLLRTRQEEKFQEKYKIENATSWRYENISAERKRVLINWQKNLRLHKYPMKLLAFSKGCVVLNQFLYEFHYAKGLEPKQVDSRFIDRIRDIYWLDSGNCGRQNVYVTSMGLLKTLAALDVIVHVHGSMYMTEDENRPWIKKQFNEFIKGIIKFNGNVIHFRHVSFSEDLESHFRVLLQFKYAERRHKKGINSPRVRRRRKVSPVPEEPATEAPVRVRARPEIQPPQSETIGYCLVKPHVTPYLGLQMLKLEPGITPEPTYIRASCPQYKNAVQIMSSDSTQSSDQILSFFAEPLMSAYTPSTPFQTTSAQMPSTSAQPSTSEHTPSTTVQKPSPFMIVSSSDLPNTNIDAPMLWNELLYLLTEEEVAKYKTMSYCKLLAPVVAIPIEDNPLSLNVYWPCKDIYVPSVYNHHFVVNRENKKDEGEDLPDFFNDEEPPPAADGLNPRRATSSSNSMAVSRSAQNASGPVSLNPGPRADLSSPDVSNPDSADDISNPDSVDDVSNPDSVDDISNPNSADDISNPDSAEDISNPDSADVVSNSDSAEDISNPDSADEVSDPDSAEDISDPESAEDVSNPDSADDVSNPDSAEDVSNPNSDDEVSDPDTPDEVSNLDSADEVLNPDSADDVSNPDSHFSGSADDASASDSDSSSLRTLSPVNSRIGSRSGLGDTLSTSILINGVSDVHASSSRVAIASGLSLHSTSVTQLEPNSVADRPVISERVTRFRKHIAQPDVSQNQVDTPREPIYSQSTSSGSQVAISSNDSVGPRAGTARARVRARDVDDEPPHRYNLRKRTKLSYDENIFRIQHQ